MDTASVIGTSKEAHRFAHRHDDAVLVDTVARAVRTALRRDEAVVWIGTDTGLRWLEARLTVLGVDLTRARIDRRVLCLDATRTHTAITLDGMTDVVRFAEIVGAPIDKIANRHARVAIFVETDTRDLASNASALEALLKSFAQSRAVFSHRAYRTPACRCEPTTTDGRDRWRVGAARPSLAIPIVFNIIPKERT